MTAIDHLERSSPELFVRRYLEPSVPCVMSGMIDDWASARWTPAYFKQTFPGIEISYETWDGDESRNDPLEFVSKQKRLTETVAEFVDRISAGEAASRKYYCAEWRVLRAIPQLSKAIGSLEPFMGFSRAAPARLRRLLQLEPLLWMGPRGVISTLHFDRAHNFFVQLHGHKKWLLIAPQRSRQVYYPCAELPLSRLHMSPVDVEHPDYARFPAFRDAEPIEIVLQPGQVLFIPAGWWHYVRALDTSISLNFFWLLPSIAARLRGHVYHSVRRRLLDQLGLTGHAAAAPALAPR